MQDDGRLDAYLTLEQMAEDLKRAIIINDVRDTDILLEKFTVALQKQSPRTTKAMLATNFLGLAAESNAPDTLKYLITQGADVNLHLTANVVMDHHSSPSRLHQALYYSADKTALALVEAGADLKVKDRDGDTPMHYAVRYCSHNSRILAAMFERGADPHAVNGLGFSAYAKADASEKNFLDYCIEKRKGTEALEAIRKQAAAHREQLKKHPPAGGFKNKPR